MKNKYMVTVITIIACVIMLFVDGILKPTYWIKSAIKVIFFLLIPILIMSLNKEMSLKSIFKVDKKGIKQALITGVFIYVIIIVAYLLVGNVFDFNTTITTLQEGGAVTKDNFIFVAIYITFINSLVEEFFFRGFTFLNLKNFTSRKFAYLFSSMAFAIYHVAMMWNWFSIWIFALIIFFLAVGGMIFNYFCEKYNNIYMSWIVHMFANMSINTIGLMLLDLIKFV